MRNMKSAYERVLLILLTQFHTLNEQIKGEYSL